MKSPEAPKPVAEITPQRLQGIVSVIEDVCTECGIELPVLSKEEQEVIKSFAGKEDGEDYQAIISDLHKFTVEMHDMNALERGEYMKKNARDLSFVLARARQMIEHKEARIASSTSPNLVLSFPQEPRE